MRRPLVLGALLGSLLATTLGVAPSSATSTQTITRDVTIPAPPAAAFAGTSGGDGFDVSLVNGRIYNVFHHGASTFTVACLDESTGVKCIDSSTAQSVWPKTLTDATYGSVGSPGQSWTFVNPDKTRLYGWAQKSGVHGGMMCMRLDVPDNTADHSCGYTVLTEYVAPDTSTVSETSTVSQWSSQDWGSNARVGDKVYSHYPSNDGTKMFLACFDLSTGAQCANAPFILSDLTGVSRTGARTMAIGTRVYTSASVTGGVKKLTCWDTTTSAECEANNSWPVTITNTYVATPIVDTNGDVNGICSLAGALTVCFDHLTGASITTPAVLASSTFNASSWWGATTLVGTRLIIPDQGVKVHCIDFGVSPAELCADSPFIPQNLGLLYSATQDPLRAGCMWLNADNGTSQIQNFDAYTMQPGCSGTQRVSTTQFIPDLPNCPIISWLSFQVVDPATWTSASISVTTAGGAPLTGGANIALTPGQVVNLSGVDVASVPNPTFSLAFTGATIAPTGVVTKFKFVTDGSPACSLPGDVTVAGSELPPPSGPVWVAPMLGLGPVVITGERYPSTVLTCLAPAFDPAADSASFMWFLDGAVIGSSDDANGPFTATVSIPANAKEGAAVVCQVVGRTTDKSSTVSGETSVRIKPVAPVQPPTPRVDNCNLATDANFVVSFAVLKSNLSAAARRNAQATSGSGCTGTFYVTGYVQPTKNRANDTSLSMSRARSLVAALKVAHPNARFVVRAAGRITGSECETASQNRCAVVTKAS